MIDFACKRFDLSEIIKCGLGLSKTDYTILYKMLHLDEFYSSKEISDKIGLDVTTVQRSLKKLYEKGIILRKQINLDKGGYLFLYKIKPKNSIKEMIINVIDNWSSKVKTEIVKW
jgi:predicted transcriptional regulator